MENLWSATPSSATPSFAQPSFDGVVWDAVRRTLRVQIFGANRIAGQELVAELLRSGHPVTGLELYGRRPRTLCWSGAALEVKPIGGDFPRGDLAFLCTPPELSAQLASVLASRGTRVLDLSGAYRGDENVPLLLDAVQDGVFGAFTDLVSLPQRSAALLISPLAALEKAAGLNEVEVVALLSAADGGARDMLALHEEHEADLATLDPATRRRSNLRPAGGEHGRARVELEIEGDLKRLLARPDLALDVTALESDLERCDAFVVRVHTRSMLQAEDAGAILAELGGVEVHTSPEGPAAADCAGSGRIHVGRIRAGSRGPGSLCFFAVGDQLRVGAAMAALRVASGIPAVG